MTLLLTRSDVRALLTLRDCTAALEAALRAHDAGRGLGPASLSVTAAEGGFHVKAAGLAGDHGALFAAKVNGNFPANPQRHALPTIQGLIVLSDAANGRPLAVLDSIEVTALRTAAATALAARHLAASDAATATVVGCGVQGRVQLQALIQELPLRRVWLVDADPARAEAMAAEMRDAVGCELRPTPDLTDAARSSAVIVTCTTSRAPVLLADQVRAGTFVAAVGADNPQKQELDPKLLAAAAVVADSAAQCAAYGEVHHAVAAGLMRAEDVRCELSHVVTGRHAGRSAEGEVVVFDSTGTALQDVAAAGLVYERAVRDGRGQRLDFFA
jgi:alanine dehydrogenase